jgi:hypothetical protein
MQNMIQKTQRTSEVALISTGQEYGPIIGHSPEGYPIYVYKDPRSNVESYVVALPDGRAFYSDAHGRLGQPRNEMEAEVTGAIVAGTLGGLTAGPAGAILGAIAGALMGKILKKRAA